MMAQTQHTPALATLEEAATALFCLVDDDEYRGLNPRAGLYETLKRLPDSEVLALLALLQQLRDVEPCRLFLRVAQRFFAHLLPGVVVGLEPLPLCIGGCASYAGSSSRCGARSWRSWWVSRRPWLSRLDAAFGLAPTPSEVVGGFGGGCGVGEVRLLRRLRGKALHLLVSARPTVGAPLLRAHGGKRR